MSFGEVAAAPSTDQRMTKKLTFSVKAIKSASRIHLCDPEKVQLLQAKLIMLIMISVLLISANEVIFDFSRFQNNFPSANPASNQRLP